MAMETMIPVLLGWSVRGAVVLLAAAGLAYILRFRSAAVRHAIWTAGIVGLLALPVLSWALPAWRILPSPAATPVSELRPEVAPRVLEPVAGVETGPQWAEPVAVPEPVVQAEPIPEPVAPVTEVEPALPIFAPAPAPAADPVPATVRSAQPVVTGRGLAILWLAGFVTIGGLLVLSLVRLLALESGQRRFLNEEWTRAAAEVADLFGVRRRIRLLVSPDALTPMTWGFFAPVILLPAAARNWSASRRRDVLLHEIAHIRRADYLTQLIARMACAVMWFNPLVWLAAHRMRVEREQACDDAVIAAGSRPSDYAGHLLDIARSMRTAHAAELAAVAMARRSQLTSRVSAVLADDRERDAPSGRGSTMTWVTTAALLIPLSAVQTAAPPAPAPPEPPAAPAPTMAEPAAPAPWSEPAPTPVAAPAVLPDLGAFQQEQTWRSAPSCREGRRSGSRHGISENVNETRRQTSWWDDNCEGSATIQGDIRFTDDFRGIRDLPRGARFEIEIIERDVATSVSLRNRNGQVERRWYVDGDQQEYGPEADEWLSRALVDFFHHSNYQLDERVEYLLATGGVSALLAEAELSHGGFLKGRWYAKAMDSGQLSNSQIAQLLQRAGTHIESDHEMGRLLGAVPASAMRDGAVRQEYFGATRRMESDFERARALLSMLEQDDLDRDLVLALLQSMRGIESDHETSRVLLKTADRFLVDAQLQAAYLDAAAGLESDFEHQRVLRALVERDALDAGVLGGVFTSAMQMDSDHELGRLLGTAVERHPLTDSNRSAFFNALATVESDHEKQRVLSRFTNLDRVDAASVRAAINAMRDVESDHELSRLIISFQNKFGSMDGVTDALAQLADLLDSDFEHRRVMRALDRRSDRV